MDTKTALPSLFVSHGSPMLAVDDTAAGRFLDGLGDALQRPRAIVVASAHFIVAGTSTVGGAAQPATVHDFAGFPAPLYQLRYPAPGAPELARSIAQCLDAAGLTVSVNPDQGLDHGIWVPLRRMYPQADIPVIPLSVDPQAGAGHHHALGRALAPLGDQGILVIGSGGFVHNLGELQWGVPEAPMPDWAARFRQWMWDRLEQQDIAALLDWEQLAPHPRQAHPTSEHLMPLFVALGAAGDAAMTHPLHRSHEMGALALDAFAFDQHELPG